MDPAFWPGIVAVYVSPDDDMVTVVGLPRSTK
jgi:hypothetical protein